MGNLPKYSSTDFPKSSDSNDREHSLLFHGIEKSRSIFGPSRLSRPSFPNAADKFNLCEQNQIINWHLPSWATIMFPKRDDRICNKSLPTSIWQAIERSIVQTTPRIFQFQNFIIPSNTWTNFETEFLLQPRTDTVDQTDPSSPGGYLGRIPARSV